jgi:type IV pilus assembly protein PilA
LFCLKLPSNRRKTCGFTLIEVMVVVAVIAILALIAMPSFQGKLVRDQIVEGSGLAAIAKGPIAAFWATHKAFPADNAGIALPAADKVVNNLVRAVAVQDGAIHVTFGNRANGLLKDKTLTFRPAVIDDAPVVPVTWVCGFAAGPDKMTVRGENKTDIPKYYLPLNCR